MLVRSKHSGSSLKVEFPFGDTKASNYATPRNLKPNGVLKFQLQEHALVLGVYVDGSSYILKLEP